MLEEFRQAKNTGIQWLFEEAGEAVDKSISQKLPDLVVLEEASDTQEAIQDPISDLTETILSISNNCQDIMCGARIDPTLDTKVFVLSATGNSTTSNIDISRSYIWHLTLTQQSVTLMSIAFLLITIVVVVYIFKKKISRSESHIRNVFGHLWDSEAARNDRSNA